MLDDIIQSLRSRSAGAGRGFVNPQTVAERKTLAKQRSRAVLTPAEQEALQDVEDQKMRKSISALGYKKGGYTKSADGIAKRGKTRGTMVMCGGGMYKK